MKSNPNAARWLVIRYLAKHKQATVKQLVSVIGVTQRTIWDILTNEIHATATPGIDPDNGRRNVNLWSLDLPASKRKALQ